MLLSFIHTLSQMFATRLVQRNPQVYSPVVTSRDVSNMTELQVTKTLFANVCSRVMSGTFPVQLQSAANITEHKHPNHCCSQVDKQERT